MIKRMKEIIEYLGRKPRNKPEYKKVWRYLFGDLSSENRKILKKQRYRHQSHGYNMPNITRQYCLFCVKEGRMQS